MKKWGRAMAVTTIAGFVIAGFILSQAVLAAPAQSDQPKPPGWKNSQRPLVGKAVAVSVQMDQVGPGPIDGAKKPKPMGKTINIPHTAFVPDGYETMTGGTYICEWDGGYLNGNLVGLNAPVNFPKGAKKILHADFFAYDYVGASIWCGMYDSYPWSTALRTPILGFNTAYPGYMIKYICTPADTTIYPDHVYYLTVWLESNSGYFYGAIVYYQ